MLKIRTKLLLVAIIPGLVVLAIYWSTRCIAGGQRFDGLVINLAGRQRMLSQKMMKELLAYQTQGASQGPTDGAAAFWERKGRNFR